MYGRLKMMRHTRALAFLLICICAVAAGKWHFRATGWHFTYAKVALL